MSFADFIICFIGIVIWSIMLYYVKVQLHRINRMLRQGLIRNPMHQTTAFLNLANREYRMFVKEYLVLLLPMNIQGILAWSVVWSYFITYPDIIPWHYFVVNAIVSFGLFLVVTVITLVILDHYLDLYWLQPSARVQRDRLCTLALMILFVSLGSAGIVSMLGASWTVLF